MFTKKYFQDRSVLFLHIAIVVFTILNVIAGLVRIDTSKPIAIIRYNTTESLSGYTRADSSELYSFVIASVFIAVVAILISPKYYSQKKYMGIMLLSLTWIVLIFMFVVSNAIYNLR